MLETNHVKVVNDPLERRLFYPWTTPHFIHDSFDEFISSDLRGLAVHTIHDPVTPLDFWIELKSGAPLVISFSGGVPEDEVTQLPFFALRRIAAKLGVSCIAISDPALYLSCSLRSGWYCGRRGFLLQNTLPGMLAELIRRSHAKKVLFVGGSAGAFAALNYSRHFKDSAAFIWNPQINLLASHRPILAEYMSLAFGLFSRPEVESQIGNLIDYDLSHFTDSWTETRPVLYLQCESDHHVPRHLCPLLDTLGLSLDLAVIGRCTRLTKTFWLHLENWGSGHAPPPRPLVLEYARHLLLDERGWVDVLSSLSC